MGNMAKFSASLVMGSLIFFSIDDVASIDTLLDLSK